MSELRYPFVRVDVPAELSEEVSIELFDLGALGIEERDATTLQRGAEGKVTLVASFPDHQAAHEAINALDPAWFPSLEEVAGDAWRDAWKEHFHPFSLTPHLTIRPPWESYTPQRPDELVLELEPGRAFGTGLHATTSLVARTLDQERPRLQGACMLDVGTGSGILALVALALGASSAVAIDNDPEVLDVVRENAARNGMSARITASTADLEDLHEQFPVVVANIEARVLIPMAEALASKVHPGGLLVLSGILAGQEDDVLAAYRTLLPVRMEREADWVCLILERPRQVTQEALPCD
ncbi:MAG: 50S ribosomal protein L11 methyltransferase [Myxococcales bacterium]|nr:50S ribosomal protein L11 methyltransferase [Polyangiaceae bacterium]MDW8249632.1 50S ribosomal protein L11 methyltransferase [Myxococcales bacterium]